jgi:hypothetical protein
VSEKAAFADLQQSGELADGEPLETFERSDIHRSLQNRATCFNSARTPVLNRSRNNGRRSGGKWPPRTV